MQVDFLFQIAILVMSVVIHEVSHGWAAYYLGDPTAKLAGRLTLNPLPHIDLLGSIIIPGLLALVPGGIIFGWAKPVPYNPNNLSQPKWGPAIVAAAGPLSNLLVAGVFALILRSSFVGVFGPAVGLLMIVVYLNILLAIFNLIPIPPLDGSKILFSALPARYWKVEQWINRYQLLIFIGLILVIGSFLGWATNLLYFLMVGRPSGF